VLQEVSGTEDLFDLSANESRQLSDRAGRGIAGDLDATGENAYEVVPGFWFAVARSTNIALEPRQSATIPYRRAKRPCWRSIDANTD